jgi:hypothetical protein
MAGAGFAYIFDPERGRSRRARTRDRMAAAFRHFGHRVGRSLRAMRAQSVGLGRRAWHAVRPHTAGYVDDVTLAHRVESELFRTEHDVKGAINVSAFEGSVVLRGALRRPDEIREIESKVKKVPGVRRVESLLHLEGTPAPNKVDALEATYHARDF